MARPSVKPHRPPIATLPPCLSLTGSAGILPSVGNEAPSVGRYPTRLPVTRAMRASAAHRRPPLCLSLAGIGRHSRIRRQRSPMQPHSVTGDAGHAPIGGRRNHARPAMRMGSTDVLCYNHASDHRSIGHSGTSMHCDLPVQVESHSSGYVVWTLVHLGLAHS